jgi:hypothetical protein
MDNIIDINQKQHQEQQKGVDLMGEFLIKSYDCEEPGEIFNIGMTALATGFRLVHFSASEYDKEDKEIIKQECLKCVDSFVDDFKKWFEEV